MLLTSVADIVKENDLGEGDVNEKLEHEPNRTQPHIYPPYIPRCFYA